MDKKTKHRITAQHLPPMGSTHHPLASLLSDRCSKSVAILLIEESCCVQMATGYPLRIHKNTVTYIDTCSHALNERTSPCSFESLLPNCTEFISKPFSSHKGAFWPGMIGRVSEISKIICNIYGFHFTVAIPGASGVSVITYNLQHLTTVYLWGLYLNLWDSMALRWLYQVIIPTPRAGQGCQGTVPLLPRRLLRITKPLVPRGFSMAGPTRPTPPNHPAISLEIRPKWMQLVGLTGCFWFGNTTPGLTSLPSSNVARGNRKSPINKVFGGHTIHI